MMHQWLVVNQTLLLHIFLPHVVKLSWMSKMQGISSLAHHLKKLGREEKSTSNSPAIFSGGRYVE